MRLSRPAILAIGAVIAVAAAWVLVSLARPEPGPRGSTATVASRPTDLGGPFSLVNQDGRRVTDRDFRGRYMLVYFGYTFCPDVCPTELLAISRAIDRLGERGRKVVPVFITIDPARDTPAEMARYVAAFHPRMVGLTGSADEIAAVAKAYHVYYRKAPGADGPYQMDHTSFIYLMGPDGKAVAVFRAGAGPKALAEGVAAHLGQRTRS